MGGHERRILCPRGPLGGPRAGVAQGVGLRQRHALLAAAARLAGSRRLASTAQDTAQLVRRCGRNRLVAGECRQHQRPGQKGASRRGRTRLTAANPAPSTTWWWIAPAFRWPFASRPPMPTMQRNYSHSSTLSRRSSDLAEDQADRASAPPNSTPTRLMTPRNYAARCALAASRPVLLDAASMLPSGWPVPLGRLAHPGKAPRLPPPWRPLRTAGRPASRLAPPGLCPDLPALPRPRGRVTNTA